MAFSKFISKLDCVQMSKYSEKTSMGTCVVMRLFLVSSPARETKYHLWHVLR